MKKISSLLVFILELEDSKGAVMAKLFTRHEATAMLPLIRSIVRDIQKSETAVSSLSALKESMEKDVLVRGVPPGPWAISQLRLIKFQIREELERIKGFIQELDELRVHLRDRVCGVVEFPTTMPERDDVYVKNKAYLVWEPNDPEVCCWRACKDPIGHRRRLASILRADDSPAA